MRLYLVIDETDFYQPDFVARFLERTNDQVVGAALVTRVPAKNNINLYLASHWYYLRLTEILKLVGQSVRTKIYDAILPRRKGGRFYSVRSVFKFFRVDFIEVHDDINREEYIRHMQSSQPDVVVSSNSLYFGPDILRLPGICCINRHSALLPSYGGLFPVLQAYVHGEDATGVSVHMMTKKMDSGSILAQQKFVLRPQDTIASLYERCFACSADVLLEALEKIGRRDFSSVGDYYPESYYSFPTPEHWGIFRKRGGKFI